MKFQLADGVFPEVALSKDRVAAVQQQVSDLVATTLQLSENFVDEVDAHAWKLLKSKEKVRVFRSRQPKTHHHRHQHHMDDDDVERSDVASQHTAEWSPTSSSSDTSTSSFPFAARGEREATSRRFVSRRVQKFLASTMSGHAAASSDDTASETHIEGSHSHARAPGERVPVLVAAGLIGGSVDDVALGFLADTDTRWRRRDLFLDESLEASRVLATLQTQTTREPFRYMVVKWGVHPFGKFATPRDFVFVEATGWTNNSEGQRVGYHVRQSLELPGYRELQDANLIRGYVSTCFTFRQSNSDSVELFCRGLMDSRGDLRRSVGCSLYADRLLTVTNIVECGLAQKLMWQVQQLQHEQRGQSSHERFSTSPKCANCAKSLNKFGTLLQSGGACHCCRRVSWLPIVSFSCELVADDDVDMYFNRLFAASARSARRS